MNYYKRHLGDYARDTGHLSMLEHGAYNRLIDLYYVRDGDIPADDAALFRLLQARTKEEQTAVKGILEEFFTQIGANWKHKRCDEEISTWISKAAANKANGRTGGRPKSNPKYNPMRTQTEPNNNPDGFANITQHKPNGNRTGTHE